MKELLLALPRLARMLVSLAGDRDVPRSAKVMLAAVAVYLVSPIDLIPDFIPCVGFLDDLIMAAVVVDGVINFIERPSCSGMAGLAGLARRGRGGGEPPGPVGPARVKSRIFGARAGDYCRMTKRWPWWLRTAPSGLMLSTRACRRSSCPRRTSCH